MKKTILLAFALFTILVTAYSTGAYTSTTASRAAEIAVSRDGSALLALAPYDGPNGRYAKYGNNGALYIDVGTLTGNGVNAGAITIIENVFTITNNGTQSVMVSLLGGDGTSERIRFIGLEEGASLDVGETCIVSLLVDTVGMSGNVALQGTFTVTATAGASTQQGAEGDENEYDDGNNGHGNDEDGHDESNPGNSGGNNGNHNGQH